jgi:membrane protein DedA with SNARE-associated domain
LFISAQGQITVLSQTAIENAETPIIEQISMRTIAIILVIVAALIIGLLFWRRTRKAQKTKEE